MQCERDLAVIDGRDIIELDERHRADVLALTALVCPHYFRPRTMALGRYFGMYVADARGESGWRRSSASASARRCAREMSAICTHPDFLGRGYAPGLTAFLGNGPARAGRQPFLHVAYSNARAKALYERMGYRLRRDIRFMALRRG